MNEIYNLDYYDRLDYSGMKSNFMNISKRIVEDFCPKTVLDAGCAWGYLVSGLRSCGIEAYGIDISEYAISKVADDIKKYCVVGSLTEPLPNSIPQKYDLIVTIEVLEHLSVEDGMKAIQNLCKYSDTIIFTSTPDDYDDPTHINVQKREYWARIFAQNGFFNEIYFRPDYLPKWVMLYRKKNEVVSVVGDYERFIRQNVDLYKEKDFGNLYYDIGNGMNEEDSISFGLSNGFIDLKLELPPNCRQLRFDPIERNGCIIKGLKMTFGGEDLKISSTNGLILDELIFFISNDPQVVINEIPSEFSDLKIECQIVSFNDTLWFDLYNEIIKEKNILCNVSETSKEYSKEIETLKEILGEKESTINNLVEEIEQLEEEKGRDVEEIEQLKEEIQNYNDLVIRERSETKKAFDAYLCVINSTTWRMTKPVRLFLDFIKRKILS